MKIQLLAVLFVITAGSPPASADFALATFAGGCFWCMEPPFEGIDGVLDVRSGYAGGKEPNPRYEDVAAGHTGHREVVQIRFDPERVSYAALLNIYWRQFDPTDGGGSFGDRGFQYSPAIFYHNEMQRELALASRQRLTDSGIFDGPIASVILAFTTFYPAEDYHQGYARKNPLRYRFYRSRSGRDAFIREAWGEDIMATDFMTDMLQHALPAQADDQADRDWRRRLEDYRRPDDASLREQLGDLAFRVTRRDATEPAFRNRYWDHEGDGIYVDIISAEPLFSSTDKYDSKTGWPSFTRPLPGIELSEHEDRRFFTRRVELRSPIADSHLGHVFNDGPPPAGRRYCINSAALRFVPVEQMAAEGYAEFLALFDK